jgi:hypothetical protein
MQTLQQKNVLYVISCGMAGCTCEKPEGKCRLGFFSLFIQAVYGIYFAHRLKLPYQIDFSNLLYCYTDPLAGKGLNFWNYYFKQPVPECNAPGFLRVFNELYEVYPLRIWNRNHLIEMHKVVVSRLIFQEDVQGRIDALRREFSGKKVLGVQIRCTDHGREVEPVSFEKYIKAISTRIAGFDRLFVATDNQYIVDQLELAFGDKLLTNAVVRSKDRLAVHTNTALTNRYRLGLDVLLDCYSLSLCTHALLIHSNISYSALLFNPYLSYTLLETGRTRLKRWKTMLAFYLNKWGIRKW